MNAQLQPIHYGTCVLMTSLWVILNAYLRKYMRHFLQWIMVYEADWGIIDKFPIYYFDLLRDI